MHRDMSNDRSHHVYRLGFYRELGHRSPHRLSQVVFLTGDVLSAEARAFFAHVDNPRLDKLFRAAAVRRVIQQRLEG